MEIPSVNCHRPSLLALFLLVVLANSATAAEPKKPPPEEPSWKAGVATGKITPQQPMWMAGYGARKKPSEGTTQDLFAKALALEDERGERAVIVTMDIIGVLVSLREGVEKQVQEQYKLPPEATRPLPTVATFPPGDRHRVPAWWGHASGHHAMV